MSVLTVSAELTSSSTVFFPASSVLMKYFLSTRPLKPTPPLTLTFHSGLVRTQTSNVTGNRTCSPVGGSPGCDGREPGAIAVRGLVAEDFGPSPTGLALTPGIRAMVTRYLEKCWS